MVIIERRPVNNESSLHSSSIPTSEQPSSSSIEGPVESRTEISIPLKREEPVVTKKPYVKEEVIVKKKPITETKTITEEITSENITYDNKANKLTQENRNNQEDNEIL